MNSFKSYGKVDESEQAVLETRRKTRKRITILSLSSILLVAIVIAAVFGTRASSSNNGDHQPNAASSSSVKAVCGITLYKDSCYNTLSPLDKSNNLQPEELFKLSMQVAMNEVSRASQYFSTAHGVTDRMTRLALQDCQDLMGLTIDHLNNSISSTSGVSVLNIIDDLRSWLSAAGSFQQTCIDGLEEAKIKFDAKSYLSNSTELISNSLAIVSWIYKVSSSVKMRRLLNYGYPSMPTWLHEKERKLIQSNDLKLKADAVVAKDGSGKYKRIKDALKAVPDKSKKRFVIYVKNGTYYEKVVVAKSKWNVMIIGDGMYSTIVSGSVNVVDGTPTFSTATFAVLGKGFIARDIGFENTAGAIKHQAVALMSNGDQSIFYRCSFKAFQDTLYAHANRQFYRECDIYGTVDFIFGNSAVVIQSSNIFPRTPMAGQQNTITAQGKADPNQNTGISIQNCTIKPFGNLSNVQTFLGRPWKNYSTTVFMQSMMDNIIQPNGWLPWTGNTAPPTIFYAEFENFGPGSSTKNRVKWSGLRNITRKLANQFTVKGFIQGDKWISGTGVNFKPGL